MPACIHISSMYLHFLYFPDIFFLSIYFSVLGSCYIKETFPRQIIRQISLVPCSGAPFSCELKFPSLSQFHMYLTHWLYPLHFNSSRYIPLHLSLFLSPSSSSFPRHRYPEVLNFWFCFPKVALKVSKDPGSACLFTQDHRWQLPTLRPWHIPVKEVTYFLAQCTIIKDAIILCWIKATSVSLCTMWPYKNSRKIMLGIGRGLRAEWTIKCVRQWAFKLTSPFHSPP